MQQNSKKKGRGRCLKPCSLRHNMIHGEHIHQNKQNIKGEALILVVSDGTSTFKI